jgi:hypothetical protein
MTVPVMAEDADNGASQRTVARRRARMCPPICDDTKQYADAADLLNRRSRQRKSFAQRGVGPLVKALPILLLAAGVLSCSGAAPAAEPTVRIRTIAKGAYASAQETQPRSVAARDAETFRRLWTSLIGTDQIPPVDFTREAAIFLLGGERRTGGFEVVATGASMRGDVLVIDGAVNPPPPGSMTTQAIAYPFAVVAVDRRDFASVEWQP